jgi:hypothetical protein
MYALWIVALMLLANTAWAEDFAGTWNVTIKSPMGERTAQMVINADGKGTFDGKETAFKVEGDTVTFPVVRTTQMGEMTLNYTGKLADGKIDGTMAMAGGPPGGGPGGPGGPGGGGPGAGAGGPGGPGGGAGGPGGPGGGMAPPTWSAVRAQ